MPDITVWNPAGPKLAAVPGLPQVRIIRWWIDDEGNDKKMIIHPHFWWYLKHNNPKKLLPIILSFFSSKTRQEDERSGEEEWKNVQVVRIYNNKEGSWKQKMLILRQSHTRKNNKPDFPPVPNSSLNPTQLPDIFSMPDLIKLWKWSDYGYYPKCQDLPDILGKPKVLVIPRCDWVFAIFSDLNIGPRGVPIYPEIPNRTPQNESKWGTRKYPIIYFNTLPDPNMTSVFFSTPDPILKKKT